MALTDEQVEILFGKFDSLSRQLNKLAAQIQVFLDASAITDPVSWRKWTLLNRKAQLNALVNQYSVEVVDQWRQEIEADWYPMITGAMMALDNSYLLVKFSDGIYGDDAASVPVAVSAFSIKFRLNGSTSLAGVSISSITKRDGTALTGGEEILRFNLTLSGIPAGVETIEIRPADDFSVFDADGKPATIDQTSGEVEFGEV